MIRERKKRVYLDFASTTPVSPIVLRSMMPYFSDFFGNSESVHSFGQEAIQALDEARISIAENINANFREIIFTSSATEANNIFIQGALKRFKKLFPQRIPKIIMSSIEHSSIFNLGQFFLNDGIDVVFLPPDKRGFISAKLLESTLDENTFCVSVMHGNNEIGIIQPINELAFVTKTFKKNNMFPLFHTDAVQSFQFLPINFDVFNGDAFTLSGHKIYGPKGVGVLCVRKKEKNILFEPIFFGGEQEFGFRPGTTNIPGAVGVAKALEETMKYEKQRIQKINKMKIFFWKEIKKINKKIQVNGIVEEKDMLPKYFLPHIINIYFPKISAEKMLIALDMNGIAVSAGSACSARNASFSRTVKIIWGEERARESLRFSFGNTTTISELKYVITAIKKIIKN